VRTTSFEGHGPLTSPTRRRADQAPSPTKSEEPINLVPARMIRAADDREVQLGRMRGVIQLHHYQSKVDGLKGHWARGGMSALPTSVE